MYNTPQWRESRKFIREHNNHTTNQNRNIYCVLEDRNLMGCHNYGDIPGTLNPADGDPWDVCAFGYKKLKRGIRHPIEYFIGELQLPNGNHKLIPLLKNKKFNNAKFVHDVIVYKSAYEFFKGWKKGTIKLHLWGNPGGAR
jgi:inorganic pyrophosphatase